MSIGIWPGMTRKFKKLRRELKPYVLLLVLPLILGIVLLFVTQRVITRQIREHGELTVQHFETQASAMLREGQMVGEGLLNDTEFLKELNAAGERGLDRMAITHSIANYVAECKYVDRIYVIPEQRDCIYTDRGLYSFEALGILLKVLDPELPYSYSEYDTGWSTLRSNNVSPFFLLQIPSDNGTGSAGTIIITLKYTMFLQILYSMDAEFCALFNDDYFIATIPTLTEAPDWSSEAEISRLVGTKVECISVERPDFTYMVAVSARRYYAPIRVILWSFGIYFLAVLILGYVSLLMISRRRYRLVSGLISDLPQQPENGADDNEIFAAIMDSLRKYRDRDKSEQERQRAENMRRILNGYYAQNLSPEILTAAGIPTNAVCYYVVLFSIRDFVGLNMGKKHEAERDIVDVVFHSALSKAVKKKAKIASVDIYPARGKDSHASYVAVLCPNSTEDAKATMLGIVMSVNEFLRDTYNADLLCTVSRCFTNPNEIPDAYSEIRHIRDFLTSVDNDAATILQEDFVNGGVLLNGNYFKQLHILMNTLNLGRYEMVPAMVETLLDEHVRPLRKNYALGDVRLRNIAGILAEAIRAENPVGMDVPAAAERLVECGGSAARLNEAVKEIFGDLENIKEADPVRSACAYIHKNFSDPNLTVVTICEAVGVSVQHLSRLFRQKRDTTIMEYLNNYRITLAKTLLLTDRKLTIAVIATQVGYNSTETFTRNFRRIEGVNPTEFRKLQH